MPIIIGAPDQMTLLSQDTRHWLAQRAPPHKNQQICIEAAASYQHGIGFSCVSTLTPKRVPRLQTWVMGTDLVSAGPPDNIIEGSVLHALKQVQGLLEPSAFKPLDLEVIKVFAGAPKVLSAIRDWFNTGTLSLNSAAASEIALILREISMRLPCPLVICSLPRKRLQPPADSARRTSRLLMQAAQRLLQTVAPLGMQKWGQRMQRIPWTKEETKAHIKRRYREDEIQLLRRLEAEQSQACGIYRALALNRTVIKAALVELAGKRQGQTILAGIICGTFFKHYDREGSQPKVRRPLCGEPNSLDHLQSHQQIGRLPAHNLTAEQVTKFLAKMVRVLLPVTPAIPIPISPPSLSD